jgi:hypothetical protein
MDQAKKSEFAFVRCARVRQAEAHFARIVGDFRHTPPFCRNSSHAPRVMALAWHIHANAWSPYIQKKYSAALADEFTEGENAFSGCK